MDRMVNLRAIPFFAPFLAPKPPFFDSSLSRRQRHLRRWTKGLHTRGRVGVLPLEGRPLSSANVARCDCTSLWNTTPKFIEYPPYARPCTR